MAENKVEDYISTSSSGIKAGLENISSLTEAMNCFAFALYKQLAKDEKNIFLSPFSLSTALTMLLCGARAETLSELREILHFEAYGISNDEVNNYFDQFLTTYSKEAKGYTLAFGNALLLQKNLSILSEYQNSIKTVYHSLVQEVDFMNENEKVIEEVNNWVRENTREMIKSLYDSLDPETAMLILNAVYFKGSWKHRFDSNHTHPQVFYNGGDSMKKKEVPMMHIEKKFRYIEKGTYKALELPYEDDNIVMFILIPKELGGLQNLEDQINTDFLKTTIASLHSTTVEVTIPKFHLEFKKELKETLICLGMRNAFQTNADFSGMVESPVKVSEIVHKSVLDVNEEGSEAAAVTAVTIVFYSLNFNEQFIVDHPFLFMIYDKEKNLILFMGRVLEF